MRFLKQVHRDVVSGKNITLYLTILVAIVLPALNFFGIWASYSAPLTLAALGAIAAGLLVNRHELQLALASRRLEKVEGFIDSYREFPRESFNIRCKQARSKVLVLQTYIPGPKPVPEGIVNAAKAGLPVRMLLLSPESAIAAQRMLDVGFKGPDRINRFLVSVETIKKALRENGLAEGSVEVKFYDCLPPFSMFAADNYIFIGMFWHGAENMAAPHIELQASASAFGEEALKTFEKIWEEALPAEDLDLWKSRVSGGSVATK